MHEYGYFDEQSLGKVYDYKLLKNIIPLLGRYLKSLVPAVVLVIILTVLDVAIPWVIKWAIDTKIVPATSISAGSVQPNEIKMYSVNIVDPVQRQVVGKYAHLFRIAGDKALIAYSDLHRLELRDLLILRKNDIHGLSLAAICLLGIVIANFLLHFAQVLLMEITGQYIMHDLRLQLFEKIQALSISYFVKNPVGRLVTRVTNDVQNMYELFTTVIAVGFKDIIVLFGIAVVMAAINFRLAMVTFVMMPIIILAVMDFSRKIREAYRIQRLKTAEINTRFSESIQGMTIIQLFSNQKKNAEGFFRINHEYYEAGERMIRVMAVFMPLIELISAITIGLTIYFGGKSVLRASLSLGGLVAYISYIRMFFRPIRDISEKYNILQNALASLERITFVLNSKESLPLIQDPVMLSNEIREIRFEHISFAYLPGEDILKDISFSLRKGETVAVVGPTGSGKTTLISLLTRFYDPTKGRILVDGYDLSTLSPVEYKDKIAMVMQDPFLFTGTIRENITQGIIAISEEDIQRSVVDAGLEDMINQLPEGLDSPVREGGSGFSSGERQLISIARAFARNPEIIILDEATSYIDSATEMKIQSALSRLMENRTTLMIAHRLSTTQNATRLIVLVNGKIIETGTHLSLIAKKGYYAGLFETQNPR